MKRILFTVLTLLFAALLVSAVTTPVQADPPTMDVPAAVSALPVAPEPQEDYENEKIEAALIEKANVIEGCTVTWYAAETCGKQPGDAAYGITYSGLPAVAHLTCAVDPDVIPLYADVFVQYADGTIEQLWATDIGVKGNHIELICQEGNMRQTSVWIAKTLAAGASGQRQTPKPGKSGLPRYRAGRRRQLRSGTSGV